MTLREQLAEQTLELLGPNGEHWIKGSPSYQSRCVGEAMNLATLALYSRRCYTDTEVCDAYRSFCNDFADAALEQFPERTRAGSYSTSYVVNFNDHPDTRFADVRMLIEKVAANP